MWFRIVMFLNAICKIMQIHKCLIIYTSLQPKIACVCDKCTRAGVIINMWVFILWFLEIIHRHCYLSAFGNELHIINHFIKICQQLNTTTYPFRCGRRHARLTTHLALKKTVCLDLEYVFFVRSQPGNNCLIVWMQFDTSAIIVRCVAISWS